MYGGFGSGNRTWNSLESKFRVDFRIVLFFIILIVIPQLFIVWAVWILNASAVLLSWVIFSLIFSDIICVVLSSYLLRVYLREDAYDWASLLSGFIVNANTVSHMLRFASSAMHAARANQPQQIVSEGDWGVNMQQQPDNDTSAEFE